VLNVINGLIKTAMNWSIRFAERFSNFYQQVTCGCLINQRSEVTQMNRQYRVLCRTFSTSTK